MKTHSLQQKEEWRPVAGYEGLYEVSDMGRVRSLDRTRSQKRRGKIVEYHRKGRVMARRPLGGKGRYLAVCLTSLDCKEKYFLVHRLVAQAFIKNLEEKPCVNHLNNDGADNRSSNLEWVSYKENTAHGITEGRIGRGRKGAFMLRVDDLQKKAILILYKTGDFSQRKIAVVLSIPETTINTIIQKQNKNHE